MKVIFLDIDGVLVNRKSLMTSSGEHTQADPDCVKALNSLVARSGADIIVSSTWRLEGLRSVRERLHGWGITGRIVDITPVLERKEGNLYTGVRRGTEIQAWLDGYKRYPIDSFVILDDDTDMGHLVPWLVKTEFGPGLTKDDTEKALAILSVPHRVIKVETV